MVEFFILQSRLSGYNGYNRLYYCSNGIVAAEDSIASKFVNGDEIERAEEAFILKA